MNNFNKVKIIKGLAKAAAIARCRIAAKETVSETRKFWIERAKGDARYLSGQTQAPGYALVPFD